MFLNFLNRKIQGIYSESNSYMRDKWLKVSAVIFFSNRIVFPKFEIFHQIRNPISDLTVLYKIKNSFKNYCFKRNLQITIFHFFIISEKLIRDIEIQRSYTVSEKLIRGIEIQRSYTVLNFKAKQLSKESSNFLTREFESFKVIFVHRK